MSDAFRETNTETYRNIVTFQSGFGVIADEPFTVGSPTTTNSTLVTYNPIKPLGGVSGYVTLTGLATGFRSHIISGDLIYTNLLNNLAGAPIIDGNFQMYDPNAFIAIDLNNKRLLGNDTSDAFTTVDFNIGKLYFPDTSNTLMLDWTNRQLTGGAWTAQSFSVSGSPVITAAQTGAFGGSANTGVLTGVFYPLTMNPSGYASTGSYVDVIGTGNVTIITGSGVMYISGANTANTGVLTGTFYPRTGNPSGFVLSNQTGSFITTTQTGSFITTSQTGQFYPNANPSGFITGTILPSINFTTSINWASANTFYITLTGNTTFTFTGQKDGQNILVSVSNSGTNNFSGTWPSSVKWPYRTVPTQTSGAFTDIYTFVDITGVVYGSAVQGF